MDNTLDKNEVALEEAATEIADKLDKVLNGLGLEISNLVGKNLRISQK